MKYTGMDKIFGCQCNTYLFLLSLFGILDVLLNLPAMAYANAKYADNIKRTGESDVLSMVTSIHTAVTLLMGIFMHLIMGSMIGIQMIVIIILRLFGAILLIVLSFQFEFNMKVLSWTAASYSVLAVAVHIIFLAMNKKSFSSPVPSLSSPNRKTFSVMLMVFKTWAPAVIVTTLTTLVIQQLEPSDFGLGLFVLYILGLELTMMPSYFCTMFEMERLGHDHSKNYKEIMDQKEEKEAAAGFA